MEYDLIIIGAGPGGYVCAIRAAQLGMKVALVEKEAQLGGTCLRVGCIPSKALLHSTEMFAFARKHGNAHGIRFSGLEADIPAMIKHKESVVTNLTRGIAGLMKKNKVTVFTGEGAVTGRGKVTVSGKKQETLEGKNIVLAMGSQPVALPFLPEDSRIVNSTGALAFEEVPSEMVVIGAGAIGLEIGSVWSRLGAKVTVVEFLPRIAAGMDGEIANAAQKIFQKQGLQFHTQTKVSSVEVGKDKLTVKAEGPKGEAISLPADKVLVAVGRKPATHFPWLKDQGIELDERGRINVNEKLQTSMDNVYAIGDLISGPMLAHKAEEEGVALAEKLAGQAGLFNHELIPNVVYTEPEIASVGITEELANERGLSIKKASFPLLANGRAHASDATEGMVKIIADAKTDRLLGVHILSRGASELIASAVAHMEYGGSAEDIARTVHAHPTISESIKEAALGIDGRMIHF